MLNYQRVDSELIPNFFVISEQAGNAAEIPQSVKKSTALSSLFDIPHFSRCPPRGVSGLDLFFHWENFSHGFQKSKAVDTS